MKAKLWVYLILVFTLFIYSCSQCECSDNYKVKSGDEVKQKDTVITNRLIKARDFYLQLFQDTLPNVSNEDFYQLIFYSSLDTGVCVKFMQKANDYYLTITTIDKNDDEIKLERYRTKLNESDWVEIEYMFHEYNFWSAETYRERAVLDGYAFILEGSQLTNETTLHNLVGRSSPRYDRIGDLCNNILDFVHDTSSFLNPVNLQRIDTTQKSLNWF